MTQYILAAILLLAPHLSHRTATSYARIINVEAQRKSIDPMLVVSFIHVETFKKWLPRVKSKTNDYGLTQVHVAAVGSAAFLGREEQLYDPRTNIKEWCRLASMWRAYHRRTCPAGRHYWWAHLKWGYRIKDTEHAEKVGKLYFYLRNHLHITTPGEV